MPPLPFVSHLLPDRAGDARHLVHTLLIRFAVGVGDTGKLVRVVAQTRRLAKQIGMVLTRPRPQLHAPDFAFDDGAVLPRGVEFLKKLLMLP